jgi:hypothetical protein
VIGSLEGELRRFAVPADLDIGSFVATRGNALVKQVRQIEQESIKVALKDCEFLLSLRQSRAERLHFGEQRGDILSLRLGVPDSLGSRIALVAQRIDGDLGILAARFQGCELAKIELEPAAREIR